MFEDKNFFVYVICMFVIIMASRTVLNACLWSIINKWNFCNIVIIIAYGILVYVCALSIKHTKESSTEEIKSVRYLINGLLLFIIGLTIAMNIKDIVQSFQIQKVIQKKKWNKWINTHFFSVYTIKNDELLRGLRSSFRQKKSTTDQWRL